MRAWDGWSDGVPSCLAGRRVVSCFPTPAQFQRRLQTEVI